MGSKKKVSTQANSTLGIILLCLSLCMDGVCGIQQDIIVPQFKPSSLRMQQMLNVYGITVSLAASVLSKELYPGMIFLFQNKTCLLVLVVICFDVIVCDSIWNL